MLRDNKIVLLLLSLLLLCSPIQGQEMGQKIENYLMSQPREIDSLKRAVDYLISWGKKSEDRAEIAGYLFNRFSSSSNMEDENIAVYISKSYFLNGELNWPGGKEGLTLLELYTQFNENNLIGESAPELTLESLTGERVSLLSLKSRYTIILFFDSNCQICLEELPQLKRVVKEYSALSLELYGLFTEGSREELENFIEENFTAQEMKGWHFVMDPERESNFHKLYNVMVTPRLYLIDREKKIIGRKLNASSLQRLLEQEREKMIHSYRVAEQFIENYLTLFDLSDEKEWEQAFKPLFERVTKESLELYNRLFYLLFEELSSREEQYYKECALSLAKNYLLPYRELWIESWIIDERVVEVVKKIEENSVGALLPIVEPLTKELSRMKRRESALYLYFFSPNCSLCKPFAYELNKISKELKRRGIKVLPIYSGNPNKEAIKEAKKEFREYRVMRGALYPTPEELSTLQNLYEIERLPQTYLLDREGRVLAKTINTVELLKIRE